MRLSLARVSLTFLAACGFESGDRSPLSAEELTDRPSIETIDFGDDSSDFALDGECDDPRFRGPGMTSTPLIDEDEMTDSSDCMAAYQDGDLTLIKK